MAERYLFVGGPLHGKRQELRWPDLPFVAADVEPGTLVRIAPPSRRSRVWGWLRGRPVAGPERVDVPTITYRPVEYATVLSGRFGLPPNQGPDHWCETMYYTVFVADGTDPACFNVAAMLGNTQGGPL